MTIVSGSGQIVPASCASSDGDWQSALRTAIRDPDDLCARLGLPAEFADQAHRAARAFPLLVPLPFIARMRPGDPHDPLLRQVLPLDCEQETVPDFVLDPLAEGGAQRTPGWLDKYDGRSLWVTTGACAVHCRYCFRRHFPYADIPKSRAQWEPALAELRCRPQIEEVILSGGDPWSLTDERLAWLTQQLAAIDHVRRIRFHTRLPIVIPARVTEPLLRLLADLPTTTIVVLHSNHAAELDSSVAAACARLQQTGALLLNQAVLLRGVNDRVQDQIDLHLRLIDCGVVPYYLHQMDRVAGAHHFWVPEAEGLALIEALRDRLPGYAVPRYVREVPGEASKRPIAL